MAEEENDNNENKIPSPVSTVASSAVAAASAAGTRIGGVATREIRAIHDGERVRVYQAYNNGIADAAIAAQSFEAPLGMGIWSKTRMTWIKPSKVWMAYRCGYTVLKDENQSRVLALDVSRTKFEELLSRAQVTGHGVPSGGVDGNGNKRKKCRDCSVVVQWDPERIMDVSENRADEKKHVYTSALPSVRSIQIGLRGSAVESLLLDPSVPVWITDVTQDFRDALDALRSGDLQKAKMMLYPDGREEAPMDIPRADLRELLGMTGAIVEKKRDAVVVLGSAANPPHRGHFRCLKYAKQKAEEMGYNVLFSTVAAAPQGYVRTKMTRLKEINGDEGDSEPIILSDEARLRLLDMVAAVCHGDESSAGSVITDDVSFRPPGRCFGSALECGRSMRPSDVVTVVVVVGADRCKQKWRRRNKNGDQVTICCARDDGHLASLEESYAMDEEEGLVLDKHHFAGGGGGGKAGGGPSISSTHVRSILQKNRGTQGEAISQLMDYCGYTPLAAEYLCEQTMRPPEGNA